MRKLPLFVWALLIAAPGFSQSEKPKSPDVDKPEAIPASYVIMMRSMNTEYREYMTQMNQAVEALRKSVCREVKLPDTCYVDWTASKVSKEPSKPEAKQPEPPKVGPPKTDNK